MADQTPETVVRDYSARYLNVQAYDLAQLKAWFAEPENDADAELYATGLNDILAGTGIDIDTWEELTEQEFQDGEAWLDHIETIFAYLFEDGAYPYGEEPDID